MEETLALQLLSLPDKQLSGKAWLIRERLAQLLLSRLSENLSEDEEFSTPNVVERIRQRVNSHDCMDRENTLSLMRTRGKEDKSWDYLFVDMSEECDLNDWNRAGFTYDLEQFFYIGKALSIANIDQLKEEDLLEILYMENMDEYFYDLYNEEEVEDQLRLYVNNLIEMVKEIFLATKTGETQCHYLNIFAENVVEIFFDNRLSKRGVLYNLPQILEMAFGYTGYNRSIVTIFSRLAGLFLTYKKIIPHSREKELVERAVELIEYPFQEEDMICPGFGGMPYLHHLDANGLSTSVFLGDSSDEEGSVNTSRFHPMLQLAMDVIDRYVPAMVAPFMESID